MDWTTTDVTIPTHLFDRCRELAAGAGVSLDGFVAASMEIRCREHEGMDRLRDELADGARRFDGLRPAPSEPAP